MDIFPSAKRILLATALLAWPALAVANVGDDVKTLRARYGSAEYIGSEMLFEVRFNNGQIVPARGSSDTKNHFTVTVYFDGEHSGMELFTRNTTDAQNADLTQDDINVILANEGGDLKWNAFTGPTGKPTWIRSDKKILGRLDANTTGKADTASVLVIMANTK